MFTWCSRAVNCSLQSFLLLCARDPARLARFVWLGVQHGLYCSAFSLVSGLFLHNFSAGGFLAFVRLLRRYYAAVRLPAARHVGLIAHRFLPPARHLSTAGGNRVSRFSRMEFLYMPGVYDSAGLRRTRIARAASWPSGTSDTVGSRIEDFGAQYPACICTCQRFKCGLATALT